RGRRPPVDTALPGDVRDREPGRPRPRGLVSPARGGARPDGARDPARRRGRPRRAVRGSHRPQARRTRDRGVAGAGVVPVLALARRARTTARASALGLRVPERPDRLVRALVAMAPYGGGLLGGIAASAARYPDADAVRTPA